MKILTIENGSSVTLAYLNNLESGTVHEVINGEYTVSFVALIDPLKTDFLYDRDNVIVYNNDYFRVIGIEELHNEDNILTVAVTAEHISYDLIEEERETFVHEDRAAIYVMNDALADTGFTFTGTDVTTTASVDMQGSESEPLNVRNILFNIAGIWQGELEYFRKSISLKQQIGQDRGVDFRFGKNIKNIRRIIDFAAGTISYDVEIVQGSEFAELGYYELGDTVRTIDDALNIDHQVRIVELEKDILTGMNSRVVLGQPIGTILDDITGIKTYVNNKISSISTIKTYYGPEEPANPKEGDLWYKTDDTWLIKNMNMLISELDDVLIRDMVPIRKLYRYNGTDWQLLSDSDIETLNIDLSKLNENLDVLEGIIREVVDEHGKLIAEKLTGVLNTAVATVKNALGYVVFDDRGIMIINQPTEAQATWAMLLSSGGLLIANARNSQGQWIWRTAITGESISADQITTGTLTAIRIMGVIMTGSTIISDSADAEIKLDNGILSISKKSSNQQFKMNYRPGLPANILQSELEYYNEFKATNPSKPAENTISLNSQNSHMGLEFGNGAVGISNNWVKQSMYGGTTDWRTAWTSPYDDYYANRQGDPLYNPPPTLAQGSKLIIDFSGTYWVYREAQDFGSGYVIPAIVYGNSYFIINPHYFEVHCISAEISGHLRVSGNFLVSGTKNCRIHTEQYGDLDYSAYETADIYLGDIGESEVIDGECIIQLDEKLLACVNTDLPYQVFLTKYGPGDIWVEQRNADNFIVKGDNIRFGWEVKAKRKQYENIRFGQPKTR